MTIRKPSAVVKFQSVGFGRQAVSRVRADVNSAELVFREHSTPMLESFAGV